MAAILTQPQCVKIDHYRFSQQYTSKTNLIVCIILGVYLYMPFSQDVFIATKSKQFSIQRQIHAKDIQ